MSSLRFRLVILAAAGVMLSGCMETANYQAADQANNARLKAVRDAIHELDHRIGVTQDQLNDMKALRDQLKGPVAPPAKPGP